MSLYEDFFRACNDCSSDGLELKYYLEKKELDVNHPSYSGNTGFILACIRGNVRAVLFLLNDERVDVNKRNIHGNTGFLLACMYKKYDVIQLLASSPRVDLNVKDENGFTGIYWGCIDGDATILDILINNPRVDLNVKTNTGESCLSLSCDVCILYFMHLFINNDRVDLNIENSKGETPLMILCGINFREICRMYSKDVNAYMVLIEEMIMTGRVNLYKKDKNGMSPFDIAVRNNNRDVLKILFIVDDFEHAEIDSNVSNVTRKFIKEYPKSGENLAKRKKHSTMIRHIKMLMSSDIYTLIRMEEFNEYKRKV